MTSPAPIPLMECPIAGFQFHAGESCWRRMKPGDALELRREPGNRYDSRAISVEWNRVMLGYVPHEANYALCQMMDRGEQVAACIAAMREGRDPWQRVMMEIVVVPQPRAEPTPLEPTRDQVVLVPARPMVPFRLARAPLAMPFVPRELEATEAALRECAAEVARRFALPVLGIREPTTREVLLWGSVAFRIGADGRGLGARFLDEPSHGFPYVSLSIDLRRPITWDTWIVNFARVIAKVAERHGIAKTEGQARRRWIRTSLGLTFGPGSEFEAAREAALAFLAPDPLVRSLSNRVFGPGTTADNFNWLGARNTAVALCAVERPGMLPFLRIARQEVSMKFHRDPLAALHAGLSGIGLEPGAWKSLPRWGYAAFEALGEALSPRAIVSLAHLLQRLECKAAPPPEFTQFALAAVSHRLPEDGGEWDFARLPDWFMRALLRETQHAKAAGTLAELDEALESCVDWLLDAGPEPDANQQHAGWSWILAQANTYHHARQLEMLAPWPVPFRSLPWPPCYRVVAITSAAELVAEAKAMKNCLADYEESCRAGEVAVFSIRDPLTDERLACFALIRRAASKPWALLQVAGKMNQTVSAKIAAVADQMAAFLNRSRA